MNVKYKHGGGYKKASLDSGLSWRNITDYSTSINWKATEFHPLELIYLHQESAEYPEPDYRELKEIIEDYHGFREKFFIMTHGANEAISALFHTLLIQGYKDKEVILVGPTYSEYNKHADLNGFKSSKISYEEFSSNPDSINNKIVIIVNPNTPLGVYHNLEKELENVLNKGTIVIVDESFIDFTDKPSVYELVENNPNLFIVHSMTKFYGSAGARLGLLISSNKLLKDFISLIIPPWTISAYDNWFYTNLITKHSEIQRATYDWIREINLSLDEVIAKSKNISYVSSSVTSYKTLQISPEFLELNKIDDFRKYFMQEHSIYIRPTADFFGCPETSFRVGLRLPGENEPLIQTIKEIG